MNEGKATAAKPGVLSPVTAELTPLRFTGKDWTPGAYPKAEADPGRTQ